MEGENNQDYRLIWTPEEQTHYHPIIQAIKAGEIDQVKKAAHELTATQFGIPPEDVDRLPHLPRWVTNDALQEENHDFEKTIIVLIPPKELVNGTPTSELFKGFTPGNKSIWMKIKYDEQGITTNGTELTDSHQGLPSEMQDAPSNSGLN